jgi:type IV pilus assembly protein PilC
MITRGWVFIVAIIAVYLACRWYNRTPKGKRFFDIAKLKIPMIGKVLRKVAIARFCQTFASMTDGGVPILRALQVSGTTAGNTVITEAIQKVTSSIKEGETLAKPLEATGEFPPMVTKMIASGEDSGNLSEMLDEINRFYERDIEYSVDRLTKLMEPMLTVIVGGIVLFVLLSLYYPVFNLTKVIRR